MKPKNISKEQYIETFCRDKRVRNRQVLYVTREVHEKLHKIAHIFCNLHVTAASLVDTILAHHIELYGDMLNELIIQRNEEAKAEYKQRYDSEDDRLE